MRTSQEKRERSFEKSEQRPVRKVGSFEKVRDGQMHLMNDESL